MARDKEQTKEKIIAAVEQLLAREGFSALGVNALAREAGVDKVLIYRYFDGMPGLLRSYGGGDIENLKGKGIGAVVSEVLVNFSRALRKRPLTQEIMAWELVEQNELTAILSELREEWAKKLFATFATEAASTDLDLPAVTALFGAAINYLVIRGRSTPFFNLIEIDNDSGWQRLEAMIHLLCQRSFVSLEP